LPGRSKQCQLIAVCAKAEQATSCDVTEITLVSKILAGKYVAQVDLDERNFDRQQRVTNGDAGVRESAGIQENEVYLVGLRLLNTIDDLMLGIALERRNLMAQFRRKLAKSGLYICEASCAINARLAAAEQIEIGAIDQEQARHY